MRQFCTGHSDIVTPFAHEKVASELGLPKPKNYMMRKNKYFGHFLTKLDSYGRLNPYLPVRFSSKIATLRGHSTAGDVYAELESLFDIEGYYKFGFTREPISRFKT